MGLFNLGGKKTTNDLGIDLGTVNTLICTASKGVVLREPSVVAIDTSYAPPRVLEVGIAARDMIGRTPSHIVATRPLRDGVIAEFEWAEVLLRKFIEKVMGEKGLVRGRPGRVVVGLPSGVTEVERRAVGDAAYNAGARIVNLVAEPMAAAIGAGMPVEKPTGCMIIDIGGGTTEIAVLSLNGLVVSKSLRIAGDELNENIQHHLKDAHDLSIGDRSAEEIKMRLGSAWQMAEDEEMEVRGLNLKTGLPHTVRIHSTEIRQCLRPTLMQLVEGVKGTLEITPPELAADIVDRGIVLAGGGALLNGMDELVSREVDVPVHIANDPLSCVVVGTERLLNDPLYRSVLNVTEYDPRAYS
ncbi:MAG: rod shape-determining protein [Vampirovibrionales bacterium]|nr:rod shape-determining protein [Vampirovibrionales bacterium]